jgi:hypothetical protein
LLRTSLLKIFQFSVNLHLDDVMILLIHWFSIIFHDLLLSVNLY